MKKVIKVIVSIFAVLAAFLGIAAGIKMFLSRKKRVESEEFTFEGEELENEAFYEEETEEAAEETAADETEAE